MMTPPTRPPRRPARTICLVSVIVIVSWDVSVVMTMSPPLRLQARSTGGFFTGRYAVRDVRCHHSWDGLSLGMLGSPTPCRCGLIERGRLQRRDGCPHKLLDRVSWLRPITLATRQTGYPLTPTPRTLQPL